MKVPLQMYAVQKQKEFPHLKWSDDTWTRLREMEGVLHITSKNSKIVQFERLYMAGYSSVTRTFVMNQLRNSKSKLVSARRNRAGMPAPGCTHTPLIPQSCHIMHRRRRAVSLIDHDNVQPKDPRLPRVYEEVDSLSDFGKTVRFRATLEAERRWCGNKGEELTGGPLEMSDQDIVCVLTDLRTKEVRSRILTKEQRQRGRELLEDAFIEWETKAEAFEEEKRREAARHKRQGERTEKSQQSGKRPASEAGDGPQAPRPRAGESGWRTGLTAGAAEGDESSSVSSAAEPSTPAHERERREAERKEADRKRRAKDCVKRWMEYKVDWCAEFPDSKLPEDPDVLEDLMTLNVGPLYNKLAETRRREFGCIPELASSSRYQIGALLAESFCERVFSCANRISDALNHHLGDDEIEQLTVLKMDEDFLDWARAKFKSFSMEQLKNFDLPVSILNQTAVTAPPRYADTDSDDDEDDDN